MTSLEIHEADDWAALYADGLLVATEHRDNIYERALRRAGVIVVQGDAFLCGGNGTGRNGTPPVAPTLADVEAYRRDRDERRARAETLRTQAKQLLAEADAMDGRK